KMRKSGKILLIGIILVLIVLAAVYLLETWARDHVNSKTATTDHPTSCISCHLYRQEDNFMAKLINKQYLSPYNLSVSPDGKQLYVVAQEGNSLVEVDVQTNSVINKIDVGNKPHSVVLNKQGNTAWVSNQWEDNIYKINLETATITDTLNTGNGPAEIKLTKDEKFLYVVNSYSNNISIIDLETKQERRRLMAGNNPVAIEISPDGKTAYVSSRRTLPKPYLTEPITEVTELNTEKQRVTSRKIFKNAYIMENLAFTPSGDLAITTIIRPKNLIPSVQVERGWMMTYGIGIIEQSSGKRLTQLLVDEYNSYYSDPFDIVITPDGKKAFMSHSGVDKISVLDLDSVRSILASSTDEELETYSNHLGISDRFVITRINTGANPKGLVISPDGKKLYVAERLEDRVAVINTKTYETENLIDLEGPRRITVARKGRRLFNNSGHTFQNQYGCYTCHPDSHEDGLVYNMAGHDMGRDLANTQTLRDIGKIPPYKWNGKNQTIYKQDGMRFSTILTRTESFAYDDLDALVAYISTGIKNPPNLRYNPDGKLTPAQERGKKIFYRTKTNCGRIIPEKDRCQTCHPPPYFTNMQMADVGTLSDTDDPMKFDAPQLNNIYESPPYLHDGKAATLEEIWTEFNDNDEHGYANDLLKDQLNDLVEYLRSLRSSEYHIKEAKELAKNKN
ncbi:MAG: beta-propeller fold lactonase family protein, partial [Bacteroidota bacterium]